MQDAGAIVWMAKFCEIVDARCGSYCLDGKISSGWGVKSGATEVLNGKNCWEFEDGKEGGGEVVSKESERIPWR